MGRAPCCDKIGLKKGPWTSEEDQKLIDYIQKNGCGNWRNLPKNADLQRCGKSCRLRWTNYLRPDIKRGKFSFEEEESIIQLHSILGNKWSAIAARLPGRTDNEIKNYWNTHIRKRLLRMGIDPVTHSPRLDLLELSTILNSQTRINFSRLLGMQSLINPELLRLASSIFSTQNQIISHNNNPNPLIQPCQMQTQFQDHTTNPTTYNMDIPISNNQFMQYDDVQQVPQSLPGLGFQDFDPETNYGYYGSGQPVVDPTPSNNSSNNFSFQSVLSNMSSPASSSPSHLQSNSTYNVSSNSSIEDERESYNYCNDILKFEIPDTLDINDFM